MNQCCIGWYIRLAFVFMSQSVSILEVRHVAVIIIVIIPKEFHWSMYISCFSFWCEYVTTVWFYQHCNKYNISLLCQRIKLFVYFNSMIIYIYLYMCGLIHDLKIIIYSFMHCICESILWCYPSSLHVQF